MDPVLAQMFAQSLSRLNEIGNSSVNGSQQNSERLSAMFGVRAAQSNPVEATSIASLKQADAGGNAQSNAVAASLMTLVSALSNLAHNTPNPSVGPSAGGNKV